MANALTSAPSQFASGAKEGITNGTKGILGGFLDATLGTVHRALRGVKDVAKSVWNVPAQLAGRGYCAVVDFFAPNGAAIVHPFKAGAHIVLGVGKACESLVEAGRDVIDTGFDSAINVGRGITRMAGGLLLHDTATHPCMQEVTMPVAIEGLQSGEEKLFNVQRYFADTVNGVLNGNQGAQPDPIPAAA